MTIRYISRYNLLFAVLLLLSSGIFAQQTATLWAPSSQESLPAFADQIIQPKQYLSYELNRQALHSLLSQAPMEFASGSRSARPVVELPDTEGRLIPFALVESPVMAPALAAKYPHLKTYAGNATDGSGLRVRLGLGHQGALYAYVYAPDGSIVCVESVSPSHPEVCMVYHHTDIAYANGLQPESLTCGTDHAEMSFDDMTEQGKIIPPASERGAAEVTLKKYRLAVSATGEYSQFHGGNVSSVMAAITTATNFVNGIMENDFGIRMELVANNDTLIYLDPANDPFTGNLDSWIGQNHTILGQRIGSANYDIGHVLSVIVAGSPIAGLAGGNVCSQTGKGRGGSSSAPPSGSSFYLIIAHEMCHQLSGGHTWSQCTPDIADQLAPGTAFEPGAGSTIMSYASSCGSNSFTSRSPYFHGGSIQQVFNFVYNGSGSNCGSLENTGNMQPEVNIDLANGFFIPISTPFKLTANGSDADGDAITYCWEQFDLGPEAPLGNPIGNSPLFRSRPAVPESTRYFPRLLTTITNQTDISELLPTYSRDMTFNCTVRDNNAGAGGQVWDQVRFRATDQAGPFTVTYPSGSNISWTAGEYQIVTWDVANTDKAPVNCQKVDILLSENTGFDYPYTLAEGVPNIGIACIRVPEIVANAARIQVAAADNIFYDISNSNFRILAPTTPAFSFCVPELSAQACIPANYSTVVSTSSVLGFDTLVDLTVLNLPAGVTSSFEPAQVMPGEDAVLTISFPPGFPEGEIDIIVKASAGSTGYEIPVSLTVVSTDYSNLALTTPADGATGLGLSPVLRWNAVADADIYEVEIATSPSFAPGTIVATRTNITADSLRVPVILEKASVFYWRVRPVNPCGPGAWLDPYAFSTLSESCQTFTANDLPKNITANGTPTVESVITVISGGVINNVNIPVFQGTHTFFKDLEARLIGPDGTSVLLFTDKCPQTTNFNFGFSDNAPSVFNCPPPNNGNLYLPVESFSAFNGKNSTGQWKLQVKDKFISSGGSLNGFSLELCASNSINPPIIVKNNPLSLPSGVNAVIGPDLLLAEDADNGPAELTFTLLTTPAFGRLERDWSGAMTPGDQFTQADINNGALRYFDFGVSSGTDAFRFAVTDGNGGLATGTFVVTPSVSAAEPANEISFVLAPNPARDVVNVLFGTALNRDTRIALFDLNGRQIQTYIAPAGTNAFRLPVAQLPNGIYALSMEHDNGRQVARLVVSR